MALLTVEPKGKANIYKLELDANTNLELRRYCAFTNNAKESSVIKAALNHVFKSDPEYVEWKKDPANLQLAEPRVRRSAKANGSVAAGTVPTAAVAAAGKAR